MKHLELFENFTYRDIKVTNKSVYNTPTMFKDDVYANDTLIGSSRMHTETINLDLDKVGRKKTKVYYTVSWDRDAIKKLFGIEATNSSKPEENKLNQIVSKSAMSAKQIEKYLKQELTKLGVQ